MEKLAQNRPPGEETKLRNKANVYYPRALVTLSVVFENFGDPESPKVFRVNPRGVTIYSNSYKEADTWSIEFDAADLPVTPELVRGGQAEIYLFQTQGIGQSPESLRPRDDEGLVEGLEPSIVGLFDEVQIEMGDNGRVCTIDGTDLTSLLIAKQWQPAKRVRINKKLDQVIAGLLDEIPGANNLELFVEPDSLAMPTVGRAENRNNKRGISFRDANNYWDVIYKLCVRYGFICFVRNLALIITTPQAYIAGRTRVRKMLWGRNLASLRMSRRMGKEQVPVIEARSYDDKKRRVIRARFPRNAKIKPVTGVGTKRDEIRVVTVPGIRSRSQLEAVAESYYNLVARSEQKVEIETMDLLDLEGQDLLEMRAGDAMSIGFDSFNSDNFLLEGQSFDRRNQTLRDFGYSFLVASVIAATFDRINLFKRPFRVREVTLEWGYESGLRISAELQNYVDIRGQQP